MHRLLVWVLRERTGVYGIAVLRRLYGPSKPGFADLFAFWRPFYDDPDDLGRHAVELIRNKLQAAQMVCPASESVAQALAASRGTGRLRRGSHGRDDRSARLKGWSDWRGRACHLLINC